MTYSQGSNKDKSKILVTQPYVPSVEKYMRYVEQAFNNKWLTNGGPLLTELTERLKSHLGVENLLLVNNGTTALQIAYKLKGLTNKSAITTPFTFAATSTALSWQGTKVQFADIDPKSWNLSPSSVDKAMSLSPADAIVPVNIFGTPCDLEAFDTLGSKYNVPIIYDSAQSLLAKYKGNNIFRYGDIHCISFHATKLFHCIEGGALVLNDSSEYERANRLINFGFDERGQVHEAGINGKMSELHAAMGLCILDDLPMLIEDRNAAIDTYKRELEGYVEFQTTEYPSCTPPMYMAIRLENSQVLDKVQHNLALSGYDSRKYFVPQSNTLSLNYKQQELPVCDLISNSILCLPLMYGLKSDQIKKITDIVKEACR